MEWTVLISRLKNEERALLSNLSQIRRAIRQLSQINRPTDGRRLSAGARKRIASAQKKRWAKWKRLQKK